MQENPIMEFDNVSRLHSATKARMAWTIALSCLLMLVILWLSLFRLSEREGERKVVMIDGVPAAAERMTKQEALDMGYISREMTITGQNDEQGTEK